MKWIAIGVILAVVGAIVYGIIRRRRRNRLVSLVALLREPVALHPAVLAPVAGKVWNADLGDGDVAGADGFVVGVGPMNTISHHGRIFFVNSLPMPYTEDVDKAAAGITDMRVRELFREHRAWFSCDAAGPDGTTSDDEIVDWYRRLGTLFVEFLDQNCLLIYLPELALAFPINEDTEKALRSPDPVGALKATMTMPIIEVSDDDPLMLQAVEKARTDWPRFVAAYEARAGSTFSVKAPVSSEGNTEFIWITVTAIEGDRVYGELGNDPANLGSLKYGSKVSVPIGELNDWCYMDPQGNLAGGFTIEAVRKAQDRKRAR